MSAIREQTKDGQELITFMLRVMRGHDPDASVQDRMAAATWLADRGFGKPAMAVELTGKDGGPVGLAVGRYVAEWGGEVGAAALEPPRGDGSDNV